MRKKNQKVKHFPMALDGMAVSYFTQSLKVLYQIDLFIKDIYKNSFIFGCLVGFSDPI